MQFGKAIGTACASFAITNIDDAFVLVTFFAEATTRKTITPLKITIGQCLGFTIIIMISMIGYGVSLVLPSEPIGFLGLLPILLGCWNLIKLIFSTDDEDEEEESRVGSLKSVFKVALVTLMNGGDNIGTYIPLFSQAKGTEIAVYVVVYYILLFVWCLAAYLVMKQRHILRLAQKYAEYVVPFLYMGLGIYIVVKSNAYPWSIDRIDRDVASHPGKVVMGVVTVGLLLICITGLAIFQWKRYKASKESEEVETGDAESESHGNSLSMTEDPTTRDSQKSTNQLDVSEETQRPTGTVT
jgi:cadmium resistance protein CadD (predicted permease)